MTSNHSDPAARDKERLERFLSAYPSGSATDLHTWAADQSDLDEGEEGRLVEQLEEHRRVERVLGEMPVMGEMQGTFFRRVVDGEGGPDAGHEESPGLGRFHENQRIGHFVLRRFIASGGMGQVWEAQDVNLRSTVALKLVLPGRINTRTLELFAREARAGGRLVHPNIVRTLAYGSDDGMAWIAQELIEGSWTLKDFIDDLRASDNPPKDYYRLVADFIAQLADALHAAHEAGVIHRDVKPQNILIAPDDRPKLTDFGLARVTDDSFISISGDFAGTFAYMSPEQVTAKRMGLDHRTDIFSLGIVLYEMLAWRRPFEGDTTHQIATQIITYEPPTPSKYRSQCPGELAIIVGKALEKDPGRRYASMAEFAADLRHHMADEPIMAKPPGPVSRASKWARRHPTLSSTGALALIALVVVTSLLLRLGRSNTDLQIQTAAANERAKELEWQDYLNKVNAAGNWLDQGLAIKARASLENCVAPDEDTWEWRWLQSRMQSSLHDFGIPGGEPIWTTFSPDFRWGMCAFEGKTLRIFEIATGDVVLERGGFDAELTAVEFSADAERVFVAFEDHSAEMLDARTGESLYSFEGHEAVISNVCVSPDNTRILTGDKEGNAITWDAASGALLTRTKAHSKRVWDLQFSPDGRQFWTRVINGAPKLWDSATGELIAVLDAHDRFTDGVAFSPDSRTLVTGGANGGCIWDAKTGELRLQLADGGRARQIAVSRDGRRIVTGGERWLGGEQVIRTWDADTGEPLKVMSGHEEHVDSVVFSPDGSRILSTDRGGTARLWDADSGVGLDVLVEPELWWASFTPNGQHIITFGYHRSHSKDVGVRVWDAKMQDNDTVLRGHSRRVIHAVFSPDARVLVTGSKDGTARVWDAETGRALVVLEGHTDGVYEVSFSPDGQRLMTSSYADELTVWNTLTGEPLASFEDGGLEGALSPDGRRLLIRSWDGSCRILDTATWALVSTLQSQGQGISMGRFSPDGGRVVTSGVDAQYAPHMNIWDTETGARVASLEGHSRTIHALQFLSDGDRLASGSSDNDVRVWDSATGECLTRIETGGTVWRMSFSPDESQLVTVPTSSSCKLFDLSTGERLATLSGHTKRVVTARFSPDGQRILTSAQDESARVWDTATGECVATLVGHGVGEDAAPGEFVGVFASRFSPDGERILTGGFDKTARLWDARPYRERYPAIAKARKVAAMMRPLITERLENGEDVLSLRKSLIADASLDQDERLAALSVVHEIAGSREQELDALFVQYTVLEAVIDAIESDASLSNLQKVILLTEAHKRGEVTPSQAGRIAWPLVDPDRADKDTDVKGALALLQHVTEQGCSDPLLLVRLAFALQANGQGEEALRVCDEVPTHIPEGSARDYAWELRTVRRLVAGESPSGGGGE